MSLFTAESLENLRQRVDIVDVISGYIELKRAGSAYKALCPFHDEKTPSFTIQRGERHFHCFGCGAHGDAIQFLVEYQKMSFRDAVEALSQRFNVHLDVIEETYTHRGPRKADLKEALHLACRLYHYLLLHTEEGHEALRYLEGRGIDEEFVKQFELGLAPKSNGIVLKVLREKGISDEVLSVASLVRHRDDGSTREFFHDRITFPIRDVSGAVIGFSARKYREDTFGGKYVNSTETPLFKKSRVLYGLSYCRRRIAKESRVIIVEGQVDALRLIHAGLNIAVAALGTAFGEDHAREIASLGVKKVYLALDADKAGIEAARKVGNLFQKRGIEVLVAQLPPGSDPDAMVQEQGIDAFLSALKNAVEYLPFMVEVASQTRDLSSPAAKTQVLQELAAQVREWENPVMVHASMRQLAHLLHIPEEMVAATQMSANQYLVKKTASAGLHEVDSDRILEGDLLRWLLSGGDQRHAFFQRVAHNITSEDFHSDVCRHLFESMQALESEEGQWDALALAAHAEDPNVQDLLDQLMRKRIDRSRAEELLDHTIQKILDRNWMQRCEDIRMRIQGGQCSDDEALQLLKDFDSLKRNPPKVYCHA